MRLLLIRHGDPDYQHDCLTAAGRQEAKALAALLCRERIDAFYASPLGRAQETADYALRAAGRTAETLDWLQEFPARIDINGNSTLQRAYPDTARWPDGRFASRIVWDVVPAVLRSDPRYLDGALWRQTEVALHSNMAPLYDRVCAGLDALLARHGYLRLPDGTYQAERPNGDTLALFCHFGVTGVMLSHLWGVSPFAVWHGAVTLPTSVTEMYTEEREPGVAAFRCTRIGDCSHLYAAGLAPSFSGRFCEQFSDDTRH